MMKTLEYRTNSDMTQCGELKASGLRPLTISVVFALFVLLLDPPLRGQTLSAEKLTQASISEREGKALTAVSELRALLDSNPLDAAGTGKAWDVLGLAFEDQGNVSASRDAFERSLRAYESVQSGRTGYAATLDDYGELYLVMGQADQAVLMMKRALEIFEAAQDHAGISRTCSDLAGALFSQGNFRAGKKSLERAVEESRLTNELDDDDRASLASLRGWLGQHSGDLKISVAKYQESLDLLRRFHGEEHASTGWAYVLLGKVRAEAGDVNRSLEEVTKGVAILHRTLSDQDPRLLSAEIAYSRVLDLTGRRSGAQAIRDRAEDQMRAAQKGQCADCTVSARAYR